jgi:hypothetical protein
VQIRGTLPDNRRCEKPGQSAKARLKIRPSCRSCAAASMKAKPKSSMKARTRHARPVLQGRRHSLQQEEARRHRGQGRPQQPHLGIHLHQSQPDRHPDALHQASQHARAADPRSRDHSARSRGAQHRRRLDRQAPRHRGRHGAAALGHRVLLQGRRARRSDGHRRARHRLRLGQPAGNRRHHGACHPRQRLPDRPVPRHRHPAGRLQDRMRPAVRGRHDAHRRRRRDLARTPAACGTSRPTRSSTRTASAAISAGWSRPIRKSPAGSAS